MITNQSKCTKEAIHALRQPLNAFGLTLANLLHRVVKDDTHLDLVHVKTKLEMMNLHIQRMAEVIESLEVAEKDRDR